MDDPISILSREFHIDEFTMTGVTVPNALPVEALLQFEAIQNVLKLYSYFVFDGVRVRVVINTLPTQFGILRVMKMPLPDGTYDTSTGRRAIQYKHWLLSLSRQDSLDVTLPWLNCCNRANLPQIEVDGWVNSRIGRMWKLTFDMAADLVAISDDVSPTNFEIHVFASFVKPRVLLPRTPLFDPPLKKAVKKGRYKKGVAQMSTSQSLVNAGVMGALLHGEKIMSTVNGYYKAYTGFRDQANDLAENVGETVSKVKGAFAINLDERKKEEAQEVTQDLYGTLADVKRGVGKTLAADIPDLVPFFVYGDDKMFHSIWKIMRENPSLHFNDDQIFITGTYSTYAVSPHLFPYSTTSHKLGGYFYYFNQFFKWWSGSIELSFVIETSAFGSALFTAQYNHWGQYCERPTMSDVHNVLTITKTVKGSGILSINVPYVREYPRARTNSFTDINDSDSLFVLPDVVLTCEKLTGNATNQKCIVVTYIRPGADFQFNQPQEAQYVEAIPPLKGKDKGIAQMDTEQIFDALEHFPTFEKPVYKPFETTVEDMVSLWSTRIDRSTPPSHPYSGDDRLVLQSVGMITGLFDMMVQLFLFNSGDITFKYAWDASSTAQAGFGNFTPALDTYNLTSPTDGKSYGKGDFRPVDTVNSPWYESTNVYQNVRYYSAPTSKNHMYFYSTSTVEGGFETFWLKAGPSFQLMHLVPPPFVEDWPWHTSATRATLP